MLAENGAPGKGSVNNKAGEASKNQKTSHHILRRSSVVEEGEEDVPLFQSGDSVTCKYHDGKLYPCRVINVRKTDKGYFEYRVHYRDWNKRYDEWVVASKLLAEEIPQRRPKKVREAPTGNSSGPAQDGSVFHKVINFALFESLRAVLEEDKSRMKSSLVELPAKVPISKIFYTYVFYQSEKGNGNAERNAILLCVQMQKLFDKCLTGWLLYEVEAAQHTELCAKHENTPLCDLYGFVHLLRLIYSMKYLLRYFMVPDAMVVEAINVVNDLCSFLEAKLEELKAAVTYIPL